MNDAWSLVQKLALLPVSEQTLGRVVRELATAPVPGAMDVAVSLQPAPTVAPSTSANIGRTPGSASPEASACLFEMGNGSLSGHAAPPVFASQSQTKAAEQQAVLDRGPRPPVKGTYLVVHLPQGRTSVYLPHSLMQRLCEHKGSAQAAREHVRQLARRAPAGVTSRSGWVHQQLLRELLSAP